MTSKAPNKKKAHPERDLQIACVKWFRLTQKDKLIFAVANGGTRNVREATFLKAQGVLAGVADLVILIPYGRCIFIELKSEKGKQSLHQYAFVDVCKKMGFQYKVVNSFDNFIEVVNDL